MYANAMGTASTRIETTACNVHAALAVFSMICLVSRAGRAEPAAPTGGEPKAAKAQSAAAVAVAEELPRASLALLPGAGTELGVGLQVDIRVVEGLLLGAHGHFGSELVDIGANQWLYFAAGIQLGYRIELVPERWLTLTPYAGVSGIPKAGVLTGDIEHDPVAFRGALRLDSSLSVNYLLVGLQLDAMPLGVRYLYSPDQAFPEGRHVLPFIRGSLVIGAQI